MLEGAYRIGRKPEPNIAQAEADSTLLDKPAFKAAATDDVGCFAALYPDSMPALMQVV
jgi:hypothetical protein